MAMTDKQQTFSHDDDSVVVVIGSGAGGGTLANELAQQGIDVVVLEAGALHTRSDFLADEWASFAQLAWLDTRTTSAAGDWPATSPTCRPGSSRRWAAPPCTGQGPACASSPMSSRR